LGFSINYFPSLKDREIFNGVLNFIFSPRGHKDKLELSGGTFVVSVHGFIVTFNSFVFDTRHQETCAHGETLFLAGFLQHIVIRFDYNIVHQYEEFLCGSQK